MRLRDCLPALAAWPLLVATLPAVELEKIDRHIAREPEYRSQPKYCLVVFGPGAETRVWLVEDGETLYVDRNANGDLTDPGESLSPIDQRELHVLRDGKRVPYREQDYAADDVVPADGSGPHTNFRLSRYQIGDEPAKHVLSIEAGGAVLQYAGWGPLFDEKREQAAIVHFGGAVIPQAIRRKTLTLSEPRQELHVRFGTPGSGRYSFASVGYRAVPADVYPIAEIEWPVDGATARPVRTTVTLTKRC